MLKRLVNQAKERIHEQIDAAKKGKKFNEAKYYEKLRKDKYGIFDKDDWEEEQDETGRTVRRRRKKVGFKFFETFFSMVLISKLDGVAHIWLIH